MTEGVGGFLITIKNGPAIYHAGDTDLFSDMSLINKFHKVNIMLVPIGDTSPWDLNAPQSGQTG